MTPFASLLPLLWPGYAACFDDLLERPVAFVLLGRFDSVEALHQAGLAGWRQALQEASVRFQERTLVKLLTWAAQAAGGVPAAAYHRQIALGYQEDHARKLLEIKQLEREQAARLARTAYVLLLSFPGVNVVSAAEFAGEMGPLGNYATPQAITGRAGLRPARYQSDQVDHRDGPLVRACNHKLRAALMQIADNLILCNSHFRIRAEGWAASGKDARDIRVRVAQRFCRIAYHMVAGGQVFSHPGIQKRHYILDKLSAFHRGHGTAMAQVLQDLQAAVVPLPREEYVAEARPLVEELKRIENGRRRGPQLLGNILPIVLARLGVQAVQSPESGEADSR